MVVRRTFSHRYTGCCTAGHLAATVFAPLGQYRANVPRAGGGKATSDGNAVTSVPAEGFA